MLSIYPLFKTKPRMPFKLASFLNIRENTLIVKPMHNALVIHYICIYIYPVWIIHMVEDNLYIEATILFYNVELSLRREIVTRMQAFAKMIMHVSRRNLS